MNVPNGRNPMLKIICIVELVLLLVVGVIYFTNKDNFDFCNTNRDRCTINRLGHEVDIGEGLNELQTRIDEVGR